MSGLTDEQHEIRLPRFPASEAAGLLGFSPYGSPLDWWELHMRIKEFDGDPELVETGLDMEDGIARGCARDLKWGRMVKSKTLVGGWLCATPDRLFPQRQRGLQIKNHGPHMVRTYLGRPGVIGDWDNNLIPMHYFIQCLFEMSVVRSALYWEPDRWCLGAYFGGKNRRPYIIRWDPVLTRSLMVAGHRFWRRYIEPGNSNPPFNEPWHVGSEKPPEKQPKINADALSDVPIPTFKR